MFLGHLTAHYSEDCHHYKGWHSLLCLMLVDLFYMFVDREIVTCTPWIPNVADHSWMFYQGLNWLVDGGMVIS